MADFEGQLVLFGGWDGEKSQDGVWIYNPVSDAWRAGAAMPIARFDCGAVSLEDKIVVLGGRNESGALHNADAYFPSRDFSGEDPWGAFEDMSAGRYGFGAASIYETIYIIGGEGSGNESAQDEPAWLWTGADWVELPTNQDYSNQRITLVSVGDQLIVFNSSNNDELTQVWAYQAFYYTIYIPFVP
jgi:N-acetylneuraminic acid mutarotase